LKISEQEQEKNLKAKSKKTKKGEKVTIDQSFMIKCCAKKLRKSKLFPAYPRYISVRKKVTPLGPKDLLFCSDGRKWPHFSLLL
jgi:hypothetical protein